MTKDLNRLSAELMGYTGYFESPGGICSCKNEKGDWINWTPLTDFNQCMMVVESMRKLGWNMEVFLTGQGQPQAYTKPVSAYASKDHHFYHAISETAQESLITAALKAKGVEV